MKELKVTVEVGNFTKYLDGVKIKLPLMCVPALQKTAEDIHKRAMDNLESSLGTSHTGIAWGHSSDTSIQDSKVISTSIGFNGDLTTELRYTSPHSRIVEYGGIGIVRNPDDKPYPIGLSQGGEPVAYSPEFQLQRGYWFLHNSVLDSRTDRLLNKEIKKAIKKATRILR